MAIVRNLLDKRIKDCADIQSFKQYDDKYIGESGYFSDSLCRFQDLKCCHKSTLININDDEEAGDFIFECKGGNYRYFLPEKLLKPEEKEYRPYTLTEFINEYSLGDEVIVRRKDNIDSIKHRLFIEYEEGTIEVRLGSMWHTLEELFNKYELYTGEGWKPFGVIGVKE